MNLLRQFIRTLLIGLLLTSCASGPSLRNMAERGYVFSGSARTGSGYASCTSVFTRGDFVLFSLGGRQPEFLYDRVSHVIYAVEGPVKKEERRKDECANDKSAYDSFYDGLTTARPESVVVDPVVIEKLASTPFPVNALMPGGGKSSAYDRLYYGAKDEQIRIEKEGIKLVNVRERNGLRSSGVDFFLPPVEALGIDALLDKLMSQPRSDMSAIALADKAKIEAQYKEAAALIPRTVTTSSAVVKSSSERDNQGRRILRGPQSGSIFSNVHIISNSVGVTGYGVTIRDSIIEAPVCIQTGSSDNQIAGNTLLCQLCVEFGAGPDLNNQLVGNSCSGRFSNRE